MIYDYKQDIFTLQASQVMAPKCIPEALAPQTSHGRSLIGFRGGLRFPFREVGAPCPAAAGWAAGISRGSDSSIRINIPFRSLCIKILNCWWRLLSPITVEPSPTEPQCSDPGKKLTSWRWLTCWACNVTTTKWMASLVNKNLSTNHDTINCDSLVHLWTSQQSPYE